MRKAVVRSTGGAVVSSVFEVLRRAKGGRARQDKLVALTTKEHGEMTTVTGGANVKEGARRYGEEVHKEVRVDVRAVRHVLRWLGEGDMHW